MSRLPLPLAMLLATLILAPIESGAQVAAPAAQTTTTEPATDAAAPSTAASSQSEPAALTLKERLGAKWKDEQRVNNCNVPPEKRGPRPRPDACAAVLLK